MPILKPTDIYGRVEATLFMADRSVALESVACEKLQLTYAGIKGDGHGGLTRASCSRVLAQYDRGTEIRNTRQLSILSHEELAQIASDMEIDRLEPEWVSANLVLSGIPHLTQLPPSSRLIFSSGAAITIDMENGPCRFPGEVIEKHHPDKGKFFAKKALGRRGVTGWVEREGAIAVGDTARLHIPPQRIYEFGEAVAPPPAS